MYCPYCFSSLSGRTLVCRNARCELYDQAMPVKRPRLLSRLPDPVRVRGGAWFADRETLCDACRLPCAAVCERCGRSLPAAWTRFPGKTILFLGVNGVGKSTLLTTSKLALAQRAALMLTPLDVEGTAERFYDFYTGPLAERGESVPHTANEVPVPFLWGVTRSGGRRGGSALAAAVYDVPGEMLRRHADTAPVEALLNRADGAVLAVNPAALPGVWEACGQRAGVEPAPDGWERAERILDELLTHSGIGTKSGVSVAVVFTHLDVWFSTVRDCASADALTHACLQKLAWRWRGGSFLTRLNEFRHVRLFATGLCRADGCRPLDGADEPLIYLLRRMGMKLPA